MPLLAGARLGVYEIVSLLGAGGMGEVYRARDPRLGRDVAIKVLPVDVASNPERLARFEQEARATAALNHPNILAVHDIGNADGVVYIVSELLEGETLRATLTPGAILPRQAIDYAIQIAHGLSAAHEKGIVHRDLKPENVFLARDGQVKILDFGLAKLVGPAEAGPHARLVDGSMLPTTPAAGTVAGMIVGTVGYMAPEQVRGLPVDHRGDIFAFGAMLYELLTGERAFSGQTPADTITAILKEDPPQIASASKLGSAALQHVVRRCLEKKPEQRFHSAHDLAYALEAAGSHTGVVDAPASPAPTPRWPRATAWIAAALAIVTIGLGAIAVRHIGEGARREQVVRLSLPFPPDTVLALDQAGNPMFAVSPDGRKIAVALRSADSTQLWLRSLDTLDFRPIRGTDLVSSSPCWSPDSRFLAFQATPTLKRVSVDGGPTEVIGQVGVAPTCAWGIDGTILVGGLTGLFRVAPGGQVSRLDDVRTGEVSLPLPAFLGDGRRFVYSIVGAEGRSMAIGSLDNSGPLERRIVTSLGGNALLADGTLFSSRGHQVVAQAFDEGSLRVTGEPAIIADDVPVASPGRAPFSVSRRGGTLAYVAGHAANPAEARFTWFDREGHQQGGVGDPGFLFTMSFSHDDTRVAYARLDPETAVPSVWQTDLVRNVSTRLSSNNLAETDPVWSPDDAWIAFTSARGRKGIYRKPAAGGADILVLPLEQRADGLDDWSRDGRFLLFHTGNELKAIAQDGHGAPLFVARAERGIPDEASFSPDGRWVVFNTNDTGRSEVYVVPFPPTGERWQVSSAGGAQPRWRGDGRELYYLALDGTMMVVTFEGRTRSVVSTPRALFRTRLIVRANTDQYVVTSKGDRFLIMDPPRDDRPPELRVIVNWRGLLERPSF
jgi:serine/threonine protein kinase